MSNVWETCYRLILEQLEALANQLGREKPDPSSPTALQEPTLRLLAAAIPLLRQHRVNKRGQCNYCGWTRPRWRVWRRRPQCTVYRSLDFAMRQPLDVVSPLLLQCGPIEHGQRVLPLDRAPWPRIVRISEGLHVLGVAVPPASEFDVLR